MARRETELLARVPLFAGLSKRDLRSIAAIGRERSYDEGAAITQEGHPGDEFYVILGGEAKVTQRGRRINRLMPGDYFGEIALLDGGPRTASVIAETPILVLAINRKPFHSILGRQPAIVLKMLGELARMLRVTERSLTA